MLPSGERLKPAQEAALSQDDWRELELIADHLSAILVLLICLVVAASY